MRSFNMGRFGSSDDPWFRVGNVDVNTTMAVVGAGVLSLFVWAAEGPSHPLLGKLIFLSDDVLGGQVWRLLTWPIPNRPDIWTLILFAVFFMLGSQLEGAMGRRLFTSYLVAMVLIPAVVVTLLGLLTGVNQGASGLRYLEIGVLVGFAVRYPTARFWPGIPAWGIAGGIVLIELLQSLGERDQNATALLLAVVGVSLIAIRALGFAEEATWIPKLALPVSFGGESKPAGGSKRSSTSRRKKRGRANLSVAPAPTSGTTDRPPLTKLEEAEMDVILEQVSENGLDSLTPHQRKRLEDHSKRLRKRD